MIHTYNDVRFVQLVRPYRLKCEPYHINNFQNVRIVRVRGRHLSDPPCRVKVLDKQKKG